MPTLVVIWAAVAVIALITYTIMAGENFYSFESMKVVGCVLWPIVAAVYLIGGTINLVKHLALFLWMSIRE